jgi:AAA+ superfamily predicted ATPase
MIERLEWQALSERDALSLLARLLNADDVSQLSALTVSGRVAPVPCYSGYRLVHLQGAFLPIVEHREDLYALWGEDGELFLLDGTSNPIYAANDRERLQLTEATVADYVRLFCFAVRGAEGPFSLFEAPSEAALKEAPELAATAKPLAVTGRNAEGHFLLDATVVYGGAVFDAQFAVAVDGAISMVDDQPLRHESAAKYVPALPELGKGSLLRVHVAAVKAGIATPNFLQRGEAKTEDRPGLSDAPALVVIVEQLLERALRNQSHNRLIETFNATLPAGDILDQFAELMVKASPVVIVETSIPFVEETIGQIIALRARDARLPRYAAKFSGDDMPLTLSLPDEGPGLVLVPLQVYRSISQVERVAFEIATADFAAIIACDRFEHLPEALRRLKDVLLRLPSIDAELFETIFARVMGEPLPSDWRNGGDVWVKHVLHTDFEHPRRMKLPRDAALDYVRAQVMERLQAVTAEHALSLKDLHGLGEARQFAEDLIADIHAAMRGELPWSQVDRGALLVGPPGTGKTTLARAIARDCGVRFINASAAGWQAEGVSLGPHIAAIRRTFAEARAYAPSILFIDEIDSLGNREQFAGTHNSIYQTEVVNAVLEQMQGLDPAAPVFVIGATNHEQNVDTALRRSGRLDRIVRIPRPNSESLAKIYAHYISKLDEVDGLEGSGGATALDLNRLGKLSIGLTGADVERIVRGAARRARKARRSLKEEDLLAEITNKPRNEANNLRLTPQELERTAVHEAGHALALFLSASQGADIGFVSIVPRDDGTLGFVAPLPDERVHLTREDYCERIEVYLAGRAAEELHYGKEHVSGGVVSDLRAATAIATRMVTQLGLGGQSLYWGEAITPAGVQAAEAILQSGYERILGKLGAHRHLLNALSDALIERQELAGDEVRALLEHELVILRN